VFGSEERGFADAREMQSFFRRTVRSEGEALESCSNRGIGRGRVPAHTRTARHKKREKGYTESLCSR
jgi:hypothetical protein